MAKIALLKIPFFNYTPESCGEYLNYEICKLENGSLCTYVESEKHIEWRDNYVIEGELKLISWERGRSSATFIFVDKDGYKYSAFMHSSFSIFGDKRYCAGVIAGKFTFEKCGQNYGIKLIPDME